MNTADLTQYGLTADQAEAAEGVMATMPNCVASALAGDRLSLLLVVGHALATGEFRGKWAEFKCRRQRLLAEQAPSAQTGIDFVCVDCDCRFVIPPESYDGRFDHPPAEPVCPACVEKAEAAERHARIISGAGNATERRELDALCNGLRATT